MEIDLLDEKDEGFDKATRIVRVHDGYPCNLRRRVPKGSSHVLVHTSFTQQDSVSKVEVILAKPKKIENLSQVPKPLCMVFGTANLELTPGISNMIEEVKTAFNKLDWASEGVQHLAERMVNHNRASHGDQSSHQAMFNGLITTYIQHQLELICKDEQDCLIPLVSSVSDYTWKQTLSTGHVESWILNGPPHKALRIMDFLNQLE